MAAEFEYDKICPECKGEYISTYYKNIEGFLYKIFIHDDGEECKSIMCDIYVVEKYTKKVYVDHQYVDYYVDNILSALCTDVSVIDLKGIGDIYFPEIDLVVEIKTMRDLDNSIRDDYMISEIFNATEEHEHYIVCILGSTTVYASSVDDYSTEDYLTRIKKIEGFLASIAARFRIENTRTFDNVFTMSIFCVSYAKWLEEAKKKPKMYFVERVPIPKGEKRMVSMLRSGVKGLETELAKRVYQKARTIGNIVRNNDVLDGIKGIGPGKKKNIIDAIEKDD